MAIKDRLIQYIMRGKDELSPEAKKAAEALDKVRDAGKELTDELDKAKGAQGLLVNFRSTGEAAERVRTTLERTQTRAAELREELNQNPGSKGLATSLRAAEREAARAGRELDKLTAETRRTEAAAKAAGIDTRNLANEEARLAGEVDKAKRAVTDNTQQLRDLERQQRTTARATEEHKSRVDSTKQAMDSAGKRVLAFAAAYISLNAALNLARRGVRLIRTGFQEMINSSSDAEQSLAQLDAALLATGERAGWSAEQLLEMADELRDTSSYTTEQIVDGQTKLLSYANIAGSELPQAMQLTIDFAQRMGMSVEQAAERIGRSLNKPSSAIGVLGRRGFELSESQQALVKSLEESGRTAEAQAIVIERLAETYGGAAAAARMGTFTGLWKGLQDQIGDFFGMIGDSGAFDYVLGKLQQWQDKIIELRDSGHLQRLAEALSSAFVQGAEKVEEFIKSLAKVDFKTLIDDSAEWLSSFGQHIDTATSKVQAIFAPFRTGANLVTGFLATFVAALSWTISKSLAVIGKMADVLPDFLGGAKLQAAADSARKALEGITAGAVDQIKQDIQDIQNTWSSGNDAIVEDAKNTAAELAAVAKTAADQQRMLDQAAADHLVANQHRVKDAAIEAAIAGTEAIESMATAMELIDTSRTVAQLEGLKEALHDAYRKGTISQEEYNNGLNLTNARIKELGGNASTTAKRVDDMITSLESFADVQAAIEASTTEMDIVKLGTVIKQMYTDGKITADEYKTALEGLAKEKERITKLTEGQSKAESDLAKAADEAAEALTRKEKMDKAAAEAAAHSIELENRRISTTEKGIGAMVMGARRWAYHVTEAAIAAATAHETQRTQVDELTASYNAGMITLSGYLAELRRLQGTLDGLDADGVRHLESAIAGAEQQMRSLGDSARSTLDSVRDELDRLRGDEEAIEKRRMESRRRELQAQLAEARAAGNTSAASDIRQAIGMLGDIAKETAYVREQEQRQNRREATQATAPGGEAPQSTTSTTAPTTVIRLESARGAAVDVAVQPGQEDALLSILEQSGLRTT